jgi:hypothetical protein
VISCGSYTGTGAAGNFVSLGYEPQWLLIKRTNTTGNWLVLDTMRGIATGGVDAGLFPNLSNAEDSANDYLSVNATGFELTGASTTVNASGSTYIYIAIRRGPMKVPTTGTSVFAPVTYTGTDVDNRLVNTGLVTDTIIARRRNDVVDTTMSNRLQTDYLLFTNLIDDEKSYADGLDTAPDGLGNSFSVMNGFYVGNAGSTSLNQASTPQLAYAFRRAPSFVDTVMYTATGAIPSNIPHNLGVAPELMIIKKRNALDTWTVYAQFFGTNRETSFNNSGAPSINANVWNNTAPTASVFTVGLSGSVNTAGDRYVAYLFASCPGVSRVGNYTGTGATLTIDCGFPGGARFVMIRRNGVGDWWVWDTARGMVAGTNPRLAFNSSNAELNNNWVYTTTGGFQIVTTDTSVNASGNTYLYLAIA